MTPRSTGPAAADVVRRVCATRSVVTHDFRHQPPHAGYLARSSSSSGARWRRCNGGTADAPLPPRRSAEEASVRGVAVRRTPNDRGAPRCHTLASACCRHRGARDRRWRRPAQRRRDVIGARVRATARSAISPSRSSCSSTTSRSTTPRAVGGSGWRCGGPGCRSAWRRCRLVDGRTSPWT